MLAFYFNVHADWYYPKISFGDKDTYQTAWYVLGHSFTMVHWPVSSVGYGSGCSFSDKTGQAPELYRGHTMLHRLPNGKPIFLHKNLRKWTSALENLPTSLPSPQSPASWKARAWQTVAGCSLNGGLSIAKWFHRTNSISAQLCNNLWFFERMSYSLDLDVSLLMRYQCVPTVKSVRIKETPFVEFVGFDAEKLVLSHYRSVLNNPGYQEFVLNSKRVPGYHHSFCKQCSLGNSKCPDCGLNEKLWEYKCMCQSPLDTQIREELKMYQQGVKFCAHGVVRYINHTLICERMPVSQAW